MVSALFNMPKWWRRHLKGTPKEKIIVNRRKTKAKCPLMKNNVPPPLSLDGF